MDLVSCNKGQSPKAEDQIPIVVRFTRNQIIGGLLLLGLLWLVIIFRVLSSGT
jgi:hypothetical protein